jgi:hypothetical protein
MGWFVVTIIVPLVSPIILIAIYGVVPLPPRFSAKTKLVAPIKDGQLCWVGMAFCASAMYEIASARGPDGQPLQHFSGVWWWAIGGLIGALVGCSFIAASGAVFSTPLRIPMGKPWYRHYTTLIWSAALTLAAAGIYMVVHFSLTG